MEHERRRDRVWKQILNVVYQDGEVQLDDIDVALYETVPSEKDARDKYGGKDDEISEHLTGNPDGTYTVLVEPDASESTKRSVLATMCKERFGFLEKPDDEVGVWRIGPMLKALFYAQRGDDSDVSHDAVSSVTKSIINNDNIDDEEKNNVVRKLVN